MRARDTKRRQDRARENAATRTSHNNPQWGHAIGDVLRVIDEKRPSGYSGRTHPGVGIKTFESQHRPLLFSPTKIIPTGGKNMLRMYAPSAPEDVLDKSVHRVNKPDGRIAVAHFYLVSPLPPFMCV